MTGGLRFAAIVLTMALATWSVAWWTVPLIAAVWAYQDRARTVVLQAGLAGATAWGLILLTATRGGAVARLAEAVGAAVSIGATPLLLLTLLYPALLATSAAALVRAIVGPRGTAIS